MEDKMAARAFGSARNYGWDGPFNILQIMYTSVQQHCVPIGHILLLKTYMYMYCQIHYPIIGICPHVKYSYSSADLMASWSCFLWITWERQKTYGKCSLQTICDIILRLQFLQWAIVADDNRSPCSIRHYWAWAIEWHPRWHPRLACDVLDSLCECYLIKYCIIGLFWI